MAHLIDKDALVAEIEKRYKELCERYDESCKDGAIPSVSAAASSIALHSLMSFINSLEVKEVDLEKEIREEYLKRRCYGGRDNMFVILNEPQFNMIAKHFFELGVNTSNPLTWEDVKLIWTIGDEIPYMPEEDFFKELLKRFKEPKQ